MFFRRRAPRLWDKMGLRPVGRGASLPATPCSSVDGYHVFGAKSDSAGWAWCFAPPNALFFRRRAPRLRNKIGFGRLNVVLRSLQCLVLSSTGTTSSEQNRIRPVERGASLPAMPCSFVAGHHVFGAKSDSAGWAWCFAPRNACYEVTVVKRRLQESFISRHVTFVFS